MDVARVEALRARGYRVQARTLPREVTPVNRVILGAPLAVAAAAGETRMAAARAVGMEAEAGVVSGDAQRQKQQQQEEEQGWVPIAASLPDSPWRRYT